MQELKCDCGYVICKVKKGGTFIIDREVLRNIYEVDADDIFLGADVNVICPGCNSLYIIKNV